ncbi:MAG: hypothetical protein Q9169_007487 [Polycauliona sp. 2 TL-2023]
MTSLLILSSHALPQSIVPSRTLRTPDECGPESQSPNDPKDSCKTKPALATNGASAFGISKSLPEHGWEMAGTPFNWEQACASAIAQACANMQLSDTRAGEWYFATAERTNYGIDTCQVGFWLPNKDSLAITAGEAGGSAPAKRAIGSRPEAAPKPTAEQCSTIIGAMVSAAASTGSSEGWSGASINLLENPADGCGQFKLPGGRGTGKAVNGDYPSYVIVANRDGGPLPECHHSLSPAAGNPTVGNLEAQLTYEDIIEERAEGYGTKLSAISDRLIRGRAKPKKQPPTSGSAMERRQSADKQPGGKMVFCHFMMGIVASRTSAADYDSDMTRAKAYGIDAFALNIGTDDFTDKQLGYAYQSAAKNGMKVFISFDFNWFKTSQTADVGAKIKQFGGQPAQLKVGGKVFVSSFAGDGLDLAAVRAAAGMPLFIAPNFKAVNAANADAAFNWIAWPSNGANKAPTAATNVTVADGDQAYVKALGGKPYMAPVSPWFFTHYGAEVSYSKNWVFPSDLLWYDRWTEILQLAPQFVEIITWNDYGESHYVGPLSSPHSDDGNSKWVNDMPHNGWLDMAKPFIAAYKAGSKSVTSHIEKDQLIYWYRPTPKSVNCDATDNTMEAVANPSENFFQGRPNGADTLEDSVFVVALLKQPGTVQVSSGSNKKSFKAQAGANAYAVLMGTGKQSFSLTRNGKAVLSGTSAKDISAECICGIYNFNAYVGTLPAGELDSLTSPTAFQQFAKGLKPGLCQPKPMLSSAGIATAAAGLTDPEPAAAAAPEPIVVEPVNSGTGGSGTVAPSSFSVQSTVSVSSTSSSSTTTSIAAASPMASTTAVTTTSTANGGGATITALSQLAPANCLKKGQVWAGPAGSDTPADCDGA